MTSLYAIVAVADTASLMGRIGNTSDDAQRFHYVIPPELQEQLAPGQLVWVPFRHEQRQGVVLGFDDHAPVQKVRPLTAIAQAEPFLQPYQLDLAQWMSKQYLAPLWDTLLLLLPPGVTQGVDRFLRRTPRPVSQPLNRDQRTILAWVESQPERTPYEEVQKLLQTLKATSTAVEELTQYGLVQEEVEPRAPKVRPRLERFVRLVGTTEEQNRRFQSVGRANRAADVIQAVAEGEGAIGWRHLQRLVATDEKVIDELVEKGLVEWQGGHFLQRDYPDEPTKLTEAQERLLTWVDGQSDDTPLPLREVQANGFAQKSIEATAARGYLRVVDAGPLTIRLRFPLYRVNALVDEWRNSAPVRAVLNYLQDAPVELTRQEIFSATGATPAHINALVKAGIVVIDQREVLRNPLAERLYPKSIPPTLTPEQAVVWDEIQRDLTRRDEHTPGKVFLLHGVTGSGKTEIYLRAVEETLAQGKQAVVLVPEISLTPQTVSRFGSRFGEHIALQHSQLSAGERYDEWRRLRDGRAQIAIGSRAALFAPVPRLGLIVIDEEHEGAYKQGHLPGFRFPTYHARDLAAQLAKASGATVILGSATPSLESYYRAERGDYRLLEMGQRVWAQLTPQKREGVGNLAPVQIVDMRQELRVGNHSIFSRELHTAIETTLAAQQQAILFLNRRGMNAFVMCRDCGWVQQCPRCDHPMTYHQGADYLICHQCSMTVGIPTICPTCLSPRVKHFGVGTEQVEVVARQLFPEARVVRWDRDTTQKKGDHERLLSLFANGQADLLIGTQMIAKGLDLPLVTLVGIISADTALRLPDFRSGERTFQLMTQVAGRAGRSTLGGRVVLQTYSPLHYAIQAASRHDYNAFYRHELAFRQEHAYPPTSPLVRLLYSNPSPREAEAGSHKVAEQLTVRLAQLGLPATDILGPAPAFFQRIRSKYRWQIVIRGTAARDLIRDVPLGVGWEVDVEPLSLL
jgi:primosomal protein N' (replication factor Y)